LKFGAPTAQSNLKPSNPPKKATKKPPPAILSSHKTKKATKPKKVQKTTGLPHTAANAQKTNAPKLTNQKKHNPTTAALPLKTHLKQTASR